jgi:NADH:ubiquinone oxidoreductase subunit H
MAEFFSGYIWPLIIMVAESLLLLIAYVLYGDRKVWAAVQMRRGPNVVGPWGTTETGGSATELSATDAWRGAPVGDAIYIRLIRTIARPNLRKMPGIRTVVSTTFLLRCWSRTDPLRKRNVHRSGGR